MVLMEGKVIWIGLGDVVVIVFVRIMDGVDVIIGVWEGF